MSKPTQSIFPIENGKLTTNLDANNLQIDNLDTSNLSGVGNGAAHTVTFVGSRTSDIITADQAVFLDDDIGATISGGLLSANAFIVLVTSSTVVQVSESPSDEVGVTFTFDRLASPGNDTGITIAILKGDGNHGFADAIADTDYASVASVQGLETSADHDADVTSLQTDINGLNGQVATLNTAVAGKADSATVTAALALKTDLTVFNAYVASNDAQVALKANTTDVNTALATKADTSLVVTGLATKEPLLPTSSNDGFVLVRDADETWRFVDPVTLGSTNASYGDGATHSNTTFNSTLAVFTTNDTGKVIVCSGNIPDDTTITFVNATTVTLSNAATTTASVLTFTILNRFLAGGGSGTVTSIGVTPSFPTNIGSLFSASVGNATTSAVITFAANTAVGANTFYGNGTSFSGSAGFMSAGVARTALGGTTVGQAVFQLANPSQVGFIRTNVDNSVTALTSAATLTALGAESALTFSAPLARATNTISIPAATTSVSGHLTSTDWNTFNAKAAGTTTLTTTAPLTIDGFPSANLTQNRTLAMPASAGNADGTGQVNGYLRGVDFTTFTNKPPNSRSIATTAPLTGGGDLSANRTLAIPKATTVVDGYLAATDFTNFATGSGNATRVTQTSGTFTIPTATPVYTRVLLINQLLTPGLVIVLPPANLYNVNNQFPFIEIVDIAQASATANFPISLRRAGGDLLDNSIFDLVLPKGIGYLRLNSDGSTRWSTTKYYVDSFKDPTAPTKTITVNVSNQTAGTPSSITAAVGNSLTVAPLTATTGRFVTGLKGVLSTPDGTEGTFTTSQVFQKDVQSTQHDIDVITKNVVPDTGDIDNIRLSVSLTAPLTITLPSTTGYDNGQAVFFYDASGSVAANNVTLIGAPGDTVNGSASPGVVLSRDFDSRRMIANPSTHNWTIESYGGVLGGGLNIGPYLPLTDAAVIPVVCDLNLTEQHWKLTGTSGIGTSRLINITGAREGERFRINYTHYTTNDTFAIIGAGTPNNGLGLLTLSTAGANALDTVTGTVIGGNKILVDNPSINLTFSALASYTVAADSGPSNLGGTNILIGSTANNKYVGGQFVAGSAYALGRIDLNLLKLVGVGGGPTGSIFVSLAADDVRVTDTSATITGGSSTVLSTAVLASDVGQIVTSVAAGIIPAGTYISSVVAGTQFTLVNAKTGGAVVTPSSSSSLGVKIWGRPSTTGPIATSTGVLASSLPTAYSTTYTSFTGFTPPISMVSGTTYWIVANTDATTPSTTDNVQWRFQTGNVGHIPRNGATFITMTLAGATGAKANFITYKP